MVLDALIKIKNELDSTLTFRRSCREGKKDFPASQNADGPRRLLASDGNTQKSLGQAAAFLQLLPK